MGIYARAQKALDGSDHRHHVIARCLGCYDTGLGFGALYLHHFLGMIREATTVNWLYTRPIVARVFI